MAGHCLHCGLEYKRNEKGLIQCVICKIKVHGKCVKLNAEIQNQMAISTNVKFFCDSCNNNDLINEVLELKTMLKNCMDMIKEQQETIIENSRKICELSCQETSRKNSYAEIVKKKHEVLLIKPINETQENKMTINDIRENIDPSKLALGIENVKNIKKGGILINCANANSKGVIKNIVQEKMGDKYEVKEGTVKNPKFIIVGVEDEYIELNEEEILEVLVEQNGLSFPKVEAKVTKKYKHKNRKNLGNIVVEVNSKHFNAIMQMGKINIGWRQCKIFEFYDITRCFNCAGYYHKANKCTKSKACYKCGKDHKTNECSENKLCCVNCKLSVEKLKIHLDIEHAANDIECPYYKKLLEKERYRIDYKI